MFLGNSSSGKGGKEEDLSLLKICKGSTFSLWLHHMQPFHLKDFLLFLSYSLFSEEKEAVLKHAMDSCFVTPVRIKLYPEECCHCPGGFSLYSVFPPLARGKYRFREKSRISRRKKGSSASLI